MKVSLQNLDKDNEVPEVEITPRTKQKTLSLPQDRESKAARKKLKIKRREARRQSIDWG